MATRTYPARLPAPSDWRREHSEANTAAIGKALEETGELTAILSRCLIQGLSGSDPKTGKPNIEALEEEVADVMMVCELLTSHLGLDRSYLEQRSSAKLEQKRDWIKRLEP